MLHQNLVSLDELKNVESFSVAYVGKKVILTAENEHDSTEHYVFGQTIFDVYEQ